MNFETLYKTYEHRLRGYAMKLTRNPDYAQDLFQDTMLRVYRSWDRFKHNSEPETKGWLFMIMRRLNINAYRRSIKIEFRSINFEQLEQEAANVRINAREFSIDNFVTTETPEKILYSKEVGNKIFDIIKNLPHRFREISTLCFIENRTYDEIAEILNVPCGTVRSRICRGRKLIQQLYSGERQNRFVFCEKSKIYHKIRISSARKTYAQCGFVRNNFSSNIVLSHRPPKNRSLCKNCEKAIKKTITCSLKERNEL